MQAESTGPYHAYQPQPFTRAQRADTTLLFGGLHWRADRLIEGALQRLGYRTRILPVATKDDLLTGREMADIGQCCPTSFTTGNLANFLRGEAQRQGREAVLGGFVHVTAGACGACRFGQYHQSYELALRNLGMESFRMFLLAQDELDQGAANGGGLELNLPFTLGLVWAVMVADVIQDLEYQTRPYEVEPGATERAVVAAIELMCDCFRQAPASGTPWSSAGWFLTTRHFTTRLREVYALFSTIAVDRLRVKPVVKITGEFYLQTVEGDPNYNIHRWLEAEGAEVYPASITVWLDYLLRVAAQRASRRRKVDRRAYVRMLAIASLQRALRFSYDRLRRSLGGIPRELPLQRDLRALASPYFHHALSGGEGDMLIGKALWASQRRKAHMICELSPYSCMPNTMSQGAMAAVTARYPDLLYAPLEIKGDAEIHALSRCQMILTEAKRRAQREFAEALAVTGMTLAEARRRHEADPAYALATTNIAGPGACRAANTLHALAARRPR